MQLAESKFLQHLRAMARVANRDLGADGLELYKLLVLDEHGDEAASAALLAWVRTNQRSTFPTPGELLAILQPQAAPKSLATEIANRLIGTIARRGYTWVSTCRYDGHADVRGAISEEFGEHVADFIDRCGGWAEFCRQYGGDEQASTLRAQLRDALESAVLKETSKALLGQSSSTERKQIAAPAHEIAQKRGGDMVPVGALVKRGVA